MLAARLEELEQDDTMARYAGMTRVLVLVIVRRIDRDVPGSGISSTLL